MNHNEPWNYFCKVNLRGKRRSCPPSVSGSARALRSYPEQSKLLLVLNNEITPIIYCTLVIDSGSAVSQKLRNENVNFVKYSCEKQHSFRLELW